MTAPLSLLFVTPECAPWVKTGGLADVSAALPRELASLGHDVKVLLPAYLGLQPLAERAHELGRWKARGPWPEARLLRAAPEDTAGAGFELLLLDCRELFHHEGGPYEGVDDPASTASQRFGLLSRAAADLCGAASPWPQWRPQVLHCNDWQTALAPAYLRLSGAHGVHSVLTIHNLAFQGLFPLDHAGRLELPGEWLGPHGAEYWGRLSFLKAGIQCADALTTVSPSYAREIQQEPLGFGFDGILRQHSHRLHGILNGVDDRIWNPASDPHIARRYSLRTLNHKLANKAALQAQMGLADAPQQMLFGLIGRLTHQKGIDLVLQVLPWLIEQGAQCVLLGQGDPEHERALLALAAAHPQQVAVRIGFDEPLAHAIEAGADAFLMPSRFEPCGLNQMYSLAYGTPPIVHATGGLADSVIDLQAGARQATGFVLSEPTAQALQAALQRALDTCRKPRTWRSLQRRGMEQRFSWRASAERYVEVYRQLPRSEALAA